MGTALPIDLHLRIQALKFVLNFTIDLRFTFIIAHVAGEYRALKENDPEPDILTPAFDRSPSVYEKLFETSDIMSDAFELCVGHFHFMLDIFLF